jgi:hypothetical protein
LLKKKKKIDEKKIIDHNLRMSQLTGKNAKKGQLNTPVMIRGGRMSSKSQAAIDALFEEGILVLLLRDLLH